jgi:hypothetical protein
VTKAHNDLIEIKPKTFRADATMLMLQNLINSKGTS